MKKGLTLLELLVVIAIIGILALMVTGNLITSIKRGRDARRKSDLKTVQSCLEQYYSVNNNQYPTPPGGTITSSTVISCGGTNTLTNMQDPVNNGVYIYQINGNTSSFAVSSRLETPNGIEPTTFQVQNQQ